MIIPNEYASELRAAKNSLAEKTKGLSPELLRLRLRAIASGGFGQVQADPLERSWAKQGLDVLEAQDGLERVAKAHAELEVSRDPRLTKAQRVLGLHKLAEEHQLLKIKLIQAAEQNHTGAAQEARKVYAERDAKAAQVVAIRAAAEERAQAMLIDNHPAVANLAAAIVARKQAI